MQSVAMFVIALVGALVLAVAIAAFSRGRDAGQAVVLTLLIGDLLSALAPPPAQAAISLLSPPSAPAVVIAPVAAPITIDPVGPAVGTMILVHGGGWAGHGALAQQTLADGPGRMFLARGWRVVSIDYEEGPAGLQDVLNAAGAEHARRTSDGPVCVYGESAGAHLALMAAARLRAIDCVIGIGTPTDLALYQAQGSVSADPRVQLVAGQITRLFGTTAAELAPWDLVALAPTIRADVLLVHEADDAIVPAIHTSRFAAARPTTQTLELPPGDPNDPLTAFMHGATSAAGRLQYAAAVGAFADRAVAAHAAQRTAVRMGCPQVTRSVTQIGVPGLQRSLRCLAAKDALARRDGTGTWRQTRLNVRGEINAARVWAYLHQTRSGRRALAATARRRARVLVEIGDRSRIILRATAARRAQRR